MKCLVDLHAEAHEGCPYVFVPGWRWDFIQKARNTGIWTETRDLVNNLNRRLTTLRKKAQVAPFTFHDLRRTCLTNWARMLPMHVVQKLAGHSDIKTTQTHYLSVQPRDLDSARQVQSSFLSPNRTGDATDQLLTNSPHNRGFSQ